MKDLANERDAVKRRLKDFNFEPVLAEDILPNGVSSWERIVQEIESCHVMVLISGERYGWIPPDGPMAAERKAITHLEYLRAKENGLPVLAFFKRLDDIDHSSDDARLREQFRREIAAWKDGAFIQQFALASDLASHVTEALVRMLQDDYQRRHIGNRAPAVAEATARIIAADSVRAESSMLPLPNRLVESVSQGHACMFAGAGISLSAGLPGAPAFIEQLTQLVRSRDREYSVNAVGAGFSVAATDAEVACGQVALRSAVVQLVDPPQGVQPTGAHALAVRLFGRILTTNFDSLFERAAAAKGLSYDTVVTEIADHKLPPKVIVKLHGSAHQAGSLMLTEREVLMLDLHRPKLWGAVVHLLATTTVVVLGTSLRDPSVVRLFERALQVQGELSGYYVVPHASQTTQARVAQWGLQTVAADADTFMSALDHRVATARG